MGDAERKHIGDLQSESNGEKPKLEDLSFGISEMLAEIDLDQDTSSTIGSKFSRPRSMVNVPHLTQEEVGGVENDDKNNEFDPELADQVLKALSGEHQKISTTLADEGVPESKTWQEILRDRDLSIPNDKIGAQILNKCFGYETTRGELEDLLFQLETDTDPEQIQAKEDLKLQKEALKTAKKVQEEAKLELANFGTQNAINDIEKYIEYLGSYVEKIYQFNIYSKENERPTELNEMQRVIDEYASHYGISEVSGKFARSKYAEFQGKDFIEDLEEKIAYLQDKKPERISEIEREMYFTAIKKDILQSALRGETDIEELTNQVRMRYPHLIKLFRSEQEMLDQIDELIFKAVITIHDQILPEDHRPYYEERDEDGRIIKVSSLAKFKPTDFEIELYRSAKDEKGKFSMEKYESIVNDLPIID